MKTLEINKENKTAKTFIEILEQCDVEVQVKYNYINDLLDDTDDSIVQANYELVELKTDLELAYRLRDTVKENEIKANIEKIIKRLDYLNEKYETLLDMWDELFIDIIK